MEKSSTKTRAAQHSGGSKHESELELSEMLQLGVQSPIKKGEDQCSNANIEAQLVIIEGNPTETVLPREHSDCEKCQERRNP